MEWLVKRRYNQEGTYITKVMPARLWNSDNEDVQEWMRQNDFNLRVSVDPSVKKIFG